tara:strand:- start:677 stop:844 length:168 start_codon:yes stop_codon:yes gene_type:complete
MTVKIKLTKDCIIGGDEKKAGDVISMNLHRAEKLIKRGLCALHDKSKPLKSFKKG